MDPSNSSLDLDSNRWQQIKQIFEAALKRNEGERSSFVSECCASDSELEAEIHRLLVADSEASRFLNLPLLDIRPLITSDTHEHLLSAGDVLCGRFEILAYIGEGGMGQVYEALDRELHQSIAIKAIRPEIADNPVVISRFRREVYATRKVTHPNVCRTFDIERHNFPDSTRSAGGITFLTMELLRGETLAQRLRRTGTLPTDEAHLLALQTASGLLAAHNAGIIHCDLKPSNIFLTESKAGFRAVVTDFGIARFLYPQDQTYLSETTGSSQPILQRAGTPQYMAPEQSEHGLCSPASDLYSFGLILSETLTGEKLSRQSRSLSQAHAKFFEAAIPGTGQKGRFDTKWDAIISGCLQADPKNRFTDAQQVINLLTTASEAAKHRQRWYLIGHLDVSGRSRRGLMFVFIVILALTCAAVEHAIRNHAAQSIPAGPSVAILPFTGMTKDSDLVLTGENITAALTDDLAQVSGLRTASHSAVRALGESPNIQVAGRELGVDTVITGSLSRVADHLELQIELVDAKTGVQLWGEHYAREEAGLVAIHQDIAQEIALRLRLRADSSDSQRIARQHSTVPTANAAYLKGRAAMAERTQEGFDKAVTFFEEAIDADPRYAPAFAELANCYVLMAYHYDRPESTSALLIKAEDSARTALQLDSTLAEAYCALAEVETLKDFNLPLAEQHYKRAIQLDPAYLPAHTAYALHLLTPLGRFAEARAEFSYSNRASPAGIGTQVSEVLTEYCSRHYDVAIEQGLALKKQYPSESVVDVILSSAYIANDEPEKAANLMSSTSLGSENARNLSEVMLGVAFARMGKRREASHLLRLVEQSEHPGFNLNYEVAVLSATLGQRDKAFEYLERSYTNRQTSILFVNVEPLLDALRLDARFRRLLQKLNFTAPPKKK